jgi:hypothetical protein
MTSRPGCQACAYVTRQLGVGTSCFLHVPRGRESAAFEAYAEPGPLPTLDQPGVFTIREYARLLVVRGRVREQRWSELVSSK